MAIPVNLPYSHGTLYGIGDVVSASYTTLGQEEAELYLTYQFKFASITKRELSEILDIVRTAMNEYASENGLNTVSSGSLGLTTPDMDDDYGVEEDPGPHWDIDTWGPSEYDEDEDEDDDDASSIPWFRRS